MQSNFIFVLRIQTGVFKLFYSHSLRYLIIRFLYNLNDDAQKFKNGRIKHQSEIYIMILLRDPDII